MNCAEKTDFTFSLRGFCKRGGDSDVHKHGFGLCLYQGRGLQCFHDTAPACQSPIAKLLQNTPMRTLNMMAHIRYATQGEVSLENVHPFSRVWKGVQMCFCHNGDCPKFSSSRRPSASSSSSSSGSGPVLLGKTTERDILYVPVGDTDSEAVFCAILNALSAEFPDSVPTLPVLHAFLSQLCQEITSNAGISGDENDDSGTIFNFLLACGQYTMFAYSWPGQRPGSKVWNGLWYIIREPPFSTAKLIDDDDYSIDFAKVTTTSDRVAVITTKPLTQEPGWVEFQRGELILFDQGKAYRTPQCCEAIEQQGRGLKEHQWLNITSRKCHSGRSNRPLNESPCHSPKPESAIPAASITTTTTTTTEANAIRVARQPTLSQTPATLQARPTSPLPPLELPRAASQTNVAAAAAATAAALVYAVEELATQETEQQQQEEKQQHKNSASRLYEIALTKKVGPVH